MIIGSGFRNMELRGHFFGGATDDIRHTGQSRTRDARGQIFGMDTADAAAADDSNIQTATHRILFDRAAVLHSPSLRRYSRFRRAYSFGAPMPGSTSCSTTIQPA